MWCEGIASDLPHSRTIDRGPKPSEERVVATEFPKQVATDNQLAAPTRQPIEELSTCLGAFGAKYFAGDIGVDDGAHHNPTDLRVSSMKNCR